MNVRYHRRQAGQSLPLIVVMLVVIIGMVGLSVDVGNAYGQQRRVQNGANAGALAAMNFATLNTKNVAVWENVKRTLKANRMDLEGGYYDVRADYVFSDGSTQELGCWNGRVECGMEVEALAPKNFVRIQVTVTERMDTYFARIVGRKELVVNANGSACIGKFGIGTYPIGIPLALNPNTTQVYRANGSPAPANDPVYGGNWDNMVNREFKLSFDNNGTTGTHMTWLSWGPSASGGNGGGASVLAASLTQPGNLQNGFTEAPAPSTRDEVSAPDGELEAGDWMYAVTGNRFNSDVDNALRPFAQPDGPIMYLPMYTRDNGLTGTNKAFQMARMHQFRLVDYDRSGMGSWLRFEYLGEAQATPSNCTGEPPNTVEARRYNVSGVARVNRVYRKTLPSNVTHDIVLVMDTSGSMSFDWNDRRPAAYTGTGQNDPGYVASDARIIAAREAVKSFVRNYSVSADPDAEMAFWTFGGRDTLAASTSLQADWARSGCAVPATCESNSKWRNIQNATNSLEASGSTPGPFAFERVLEQLKNRPARRNNKDVVKVVIFATDGVFNICGTNWDSTACPKGDDVCPNEPYDARESCTNNARFQALRPRPVWQGQELSNQVKALGATIYMVAVQPTCIPDGSKYCFDPYGLAEMSSGVGYYYSARDAGSLAGIYDNIKNKIVSDQCQPMEKAELASGVTIEIQKANDPSWSRTTTSGDTNGGYKFSDLEPGQYYVRAMPKDIKSPEPGDGLTRRYSRVRNALSLGEEGQATVYLNPQFPSNATVYSEVLLSLKTVNGVPLNGCSDPALTR